MPQASFLLANVAICFAPAAFVAHYASLVQTLDTRKSRVLLRACRLRGRAKVGEGRDFSSSARAYTATALIFTCKRHSVDGSGHFA